MTKRSVIAVLLLTLVTFGIYGLYWLVKSKREMVARGAEIPTSWLLLVPIVNYYWQWQFASGVEHVTRGRTQAIAVFLLALFFPLGMFIIVQSAFNKLADEQAQPSLPQAWVA